MGVHSLALDKLVKAFVTYERINKTAMLPLVIPPACGSQFLFR
jgi:hypothetical protein